MQFDDQQDTGDFPDLTLPERSNDVPGQAAELARTSGPHIKAQVIEQTIQPAPEAETPLRSILSLATSSAADRPSRVPRINAGILAMLGVVWGLYLLPDLLTANFAKLVQIGPFYVLTIGYVVLTLTRPALSTRYLIWAMSILVHGGWMSIGLYVAATGPITTEANFLIAWWTLATTLSIWALFKEGPDSRSRKSANKLPPQEVIVIGIIVLLLLSVTAIATIFYIVRLR
jgi:hypothetical protein